MRLERAVVAALLVAAFCLAIATLVLSGSLVVRAAVMPHSNHCYYNLYTKTRASPQVIVTGSSRMRDAIYANEFAAVLGLPEGGVINIAHPRVMYAHDLGVLQSITPDKRPNIVLSEVLPRSRELFHAERSIDPGSDGAPRDLAAGTVKDDFYLGLDFRAQVGLVLAYAPNPVLGISDALTVLSMRITQTIALARNRQIYPAVFRAKPNRPTGDDHICAFAASRDLFVFEAAELAKRRQKISMNTAFFDTEKWEDPDPLGFFTQSESQLDVALLKRMVSVAQDHGYTQAFFYLPAVHVPVPPDLAQVFEAEIGAPLLIPPQFLRTALLENGFYDNAHLSAAGTPVLAEWLGSELARRTLFSPDDR